MGFATLSAGECAVIVTTQPATLVKNPENPSFSMVSGQNDRMAGGVPVWNKFSSFVENIAHGDGQNGNGVNEASFGFSDIIDMVNPLQHVPVVSQLYQSATGDTIGAIAKIVGGAIFGGPIGAIASLASVAYQAAKDDSNTTISVSEESHVALADRRAGFKPYNV